MEVTSSSSPESMEVTSSPLPDRDFLLHLESFLSRRDGVDKLLKISRYAAKLILATTPASSESLTLTLTLTPRLKSFESSVGLSRKAFRLGKFVQDLNSLRSSLGSSPSRSDLLLSFVAYGGEGVYYFLEQLVWLSKTGLIPSESSKLFSKISAWAELVGYIGSISLKLRDLDRMRSAPPSKKSEEKVALKRLAIVQDLADGLMALADVRDGKGVLTGPALMASAGLVSALISARKNWNSC